MKGMKDIKKVVSQVLLSFDDDQIIDTDHVVNLALEVIAEDDDADGFNLCAMMYTLKNEVNSYYRTKKAKTKGQVVNQIELEGVGFSLQDHYPCRIDKKMVLVPISIMTEQQIDEQILLHKKQGDGHYAHAAELERFKLVKYGTLAANDENWFDADV